jgi:hypothetical protein
MNTLDLKKSVRLACLPLICAAGLSACASYEHENRVVTRATPAPATTTVAVAGTSTFDQLDTNHDGFLSRAEVASLGLPAQSSSPAVLSFERLDQNRDGFLSRAEAEPLMSSVRLSGGRLIIIAPTAWSFERLDIDRDGFLTRREAAPFINSATFDRYDTNRDGFLSRAEADPLFRSSVGGTDSASGGAVYGPR